MKFYLISDNVDTYMGMQLAGIDGIVVHTSNEVQQEISQALADPEIAVILITPKLAALCEAMIYEIKLNRTVPLIVEIPDRHAEKDATAAIARYVQDAIGIKL